MPLDKSKSNIGYRLGRMFAVLETVQEESNPGTDVTMREKFYSDASTTPLEVFTNLIKVKKGRPGRPPSQRSLLHPGSNFPGQLICGWQRACSRMSDRHPGQAFFIST